MTTVRFFTRSSVYTHAKTLRSRLPSARDKTRVFFHFGMKNHKSFIKTDRRRRRTRTGGAIGTVTFPQTFIVYTAPTRGHEADFATYTWPRCGKKKQYFDTTDSCSTSNNAFIACVRCNFYKPIIILETDGSIEQQEFSNSVVCRSWSPLDSKAEIDRQACTGLVFEGMAWLFCTVLERK